MPHSTKHILREINNTHRRDLQRKHAVQDAHLITTLPPSTTGTPPPSLPLTPNKCSTPLPQPPARLTLNTCCALCSPVVLPNPAFAADAASFVFAARLSASSALRADSAALAARRASRCGWWCQVSAC